MCTDKKLLFGFIIHFPSGVERGRKMQRSKRERLYRGCMMRMERGGEKSFSAHESSQIFVQQIQRNSNIISICEQFPGCGS